MSRSVLVLLTSMMLFAAWEPAAVGTAEGGAAEHVHILGFAFDPATRTVDVGTTVEWDNHDFVSHTATANDGSFDSGVLGNGGAYSFTFLAAGTYAYFCAVHPSMTAEIVVSGPPNEPPTVAIDSPQSGTVVQMGDTVTVAGTAADADGAVARVEVSVDGGAWATATGTTAWSHNVTGLAAGAHTLSARSYDGAAYSTTASVDVHVNAPPTVTIDAPEEGAVVQGTVTVAGTAADADGVVARVEVAVDGGAWATAEGTSSWSLDLPDLAVGAHTLSARAHDGAAYSAVATLTIRINAPPTLTIDSPEEGAVVEDTLVVAGTAADVDAAVELVEVSVDGGAWAAADGTAEWSLEVVDLAVGAHTLSARAYDGMAYSAVATVNVRVNAPPTVTIDSPAEGAVVQLGDAVTLTGTAADADGAVERVEVAVDGGAWATADGTTEWSFAVADLAAGAHTLSARAYDGGAYSATATVDVRVNAPPTVAIGSVDVGDTVTVAGTAADADGVVARVEVAVDGGVWETAEGTAAWTHDFAGLAAGAHTLSARAHDGAVYSAVATVEFHINAPPTVTVTNPLDGDVATGSLRASGTAADADGEVQRVEVSVDDGPFETASGTTEWSFDLDTTQLANGPHTLRARAFDGNDYSSVASVAFDTLNLPDLVVDGLSATSGLVTRTVEAVVGNDGTVSAAAVTVTFSYEYGGKLRTIGTATTDGPLAPGERATLSIPWEVLGKIGRFTLHAHVDKAGEVEEFEEGNNEATAETIILLDVPGTDVREPLLPAA